MLQKILRASQDHPGASTHDYNVTVLFIVCVFRLQNMHMFIFNVELWEIAGFIVIAAAAYSYLLEQATAAA